MIHNSELLHKGLECPNLSYDYGIYFNLCVNYFGPDEAQVQAQVNIGRWTHLSASQIKLSQHGFAPSLPYNPKLPLSLILPTLQQEYSLISLNYCQVSDLLYSNDDRDQLKCLK
jgi:hypothetical protein